MTTEMRKSLYRALISPRVNHKNKVFIPAARQLALSLAISRLADISCEQLYGLLYLRVGFNLYVLWAAKNLYFFNNDVNTCLVQLQEFSG